MLLEKNRAYTKFIEKMPQSSALDLVYLNYLAWRNTDYTATILDDVTVSLREKPAFE